MSRPRITDLRQYIVDRTVVEQASGCWLWQRAPFRLTGYGRAKVQGRAYVAHRLSYEVLVGPIPDGLVLDHLCRNRACVNPAHLEPVTQRENTLRSPVAPAALNAALIVCRRCTGPLEAAMRGRQRERFCRECRNEWNREGRPRVSSLYCKHGHELFGPNMKLKTKPHVMRVCLICQRAATLRWHQRRREARPS